MVGKAIPVREDSIRPEEFPPMSDHGRKPLTGAAQVPWSSTMGPQHPSTHGVLRVVLELDGETVAEGAF